MRSLLATPRLNFAALTLAGLAVLVASLWVSPPVLISRESLAFWVLTAFVVFGELLPIRVPRRHDEVNVSTTFAFAVLLVAGAPAAMVAHGLASLVADVTSRKPWPIMAFNLAEYTLSLAAAGAALALIGPWGWGSGLSGFEVSHVGPVFAAAVVYFLVNNSLAGMGQAWLLRTRVLPYLRRDIGFHAAIAAMLLGIAPVVLVVEQFSLWLLPLLALPIIAVYTSVRQAAINEHQALHDSLTELPNRVLFHDRVAQAIRLAQREKESVAVMIIDLNRFKEINDTLGHHHGDELLRRVGPKLREALRVSDTVARLGGDEFAILLPGLDAFHSAPRVGRKILQALEHPFLIDALRLEVGASIGIAGYPDHGEDVDTLIQRADVAMYWAKAGATGVEVYSPEHDEYSPERLSLVGELRRALERDELVLHYQPKVDLHTGSVAGVEALIRWQHPQRGFMAPDEFVPIAERTGLIRPLTNFVLEGAVRQTRVWQEAGLDLAVAVNLSTRNLLDASLPEDVADLLARYDVDPARLELEITESTIMADPARAREVLDRLSLMGVRLAIDDFGTGYSSLSQLKRLPVHELKIDKSFVLGMGADKDDAVIVQSTIDLGRNLGLATVAEGVENEATLNELSRLGCDIAQGFYMSRPISSEQLTEWLLLPARVPPPVKA